MQKFLIIQTAFIGDVILATPLIEKLREHYPTAQIDFFLRKGNEGLLNGNPKLNNVLFWDKKKDKIKNLLHMLSVIRTGKYDYVINLQRFFSSGFVTAFSKAKVKIGFDKNPLSFLFTKTYKHQIGNGKHECERNLELIQEITDASFVRPKLYPTKRDIANANILQFNKYVCIAPTSVWFTKQWESKKWIELINKIPHDYEVYLLGASSDKYNCSIIEENSTHPHVKNLAGELNFLESAALMKNSKMNFVNDSAPLHISSAMNAPTAAIFCSTVPSFGFGPLSDTSYVFEIEEKLDCRPCGLHGYKACPKQHFKCSNKISVDKIIETVGL
jgi:heptosyltransferase-2